MGPDRGVHVKLMRALKVGQQFLCYQCDKSETVTGQEHIGVSSR